MLRRWLLAIAVVGAFYGGGDAVPQVVGRVMLLPGGIRLSVDELVPGSNYIMQISCDLVNWITVTNFTYSTNIDLAGDVTVPCDARQAFFRFGRP
jgi:hypothetical protein